MSQHRYTSRLIAVVYSWQSATRIDLSPHLISVETEKEVKRVGSASIVLAPSVNWFNRLYPNDMIAIYYDAGDGASGWTWLFLGYIDRVARTERVLETGAVSTAFTIACSDFMKAVDRSEVIFRAELAQRTDWSVDSRFYFSNLGGAGTMMRGLAMTGTPDSVVESILGTFLGYGAQFQLPPSLEKQVAPHKAKARHGRAQRALLKIPPDVQQAVTRMGFGQLFAQGQPRNARDLVKKLLALVNKINPDASKQQQADFVKIRSVSLNLLSYANILEDSIGQPSSMYDTMDLSFIEGMCIDGYGQTMPLHQSVGAVSNIVYRWCNDTVNELFFDLRPVAIGDEDDAMTGGAEGDGSTTRTIGYSRASDMLGINTDGLPGMSSGQSAGIKYVPAVVMREYPFSVAAGLDAFTYKTISGLPLGRIPFGPVFAATKASSDPSARVLYDYAADGLPDGITAQRQWYPEDAEPHKHLDVATIRLDEMFSMEVSRGDADTQNLLIATQVMGPTATKVNIPDLVPIFNLASIARDGIRVRDTESPYFGFSASLPFSFQQQIAIAGGVYRWAFLNDHWYQHNPEYLSGTVACIPRADIRVGFRLDVPERAESYYVMRVGHTFNVLDNGAVQGRTTIQVARGQRSDAMPVYIPPSVNTARVTGGTVEDLTDDEGNTVGTPVTDQAIVGGAFGDTAAAEALLQGGGNRSKSGRLAKFFLVRDTKATETARARDPLAPDATTNTTDAAPFDGTGPYVSARVGIGDVKGVE